VDEVVEVGEVGDEGLIAAARSGDRRALDGLIRRHERWVRGVVYSTLGRPEHVDDVTQQVWTNVCQQIGTLSDPRRWRSWLFRLARNAAIDAGQRQSRLRRQSAPLPTEHEHPGGDGRPVEGLIESEEHRRVLQAIRGLPAIYREPFVLRHMEDWSYAQIGEALDLPVDTVETRLVRARRLLRETLRVQRSET
jgi:RNA polymerase sigma-70 factor (ECF subfamily)